RSVFEDERETERQQQTVERIAAIQRPNEQTLQDEADDRGERRRDRQRTPKADVWRDRVSDVAADDEEAAVGKVDDVAQIENERQAQRHQHVEGADDQHVRDVEKEKLGHRSNRSTLITARAERSAPSPSKIDSEAV